MLYDTTSTPSPIIMIISCILAVFLLACMWILFQKAGEAGWKSIVPVYNVYVLYKLTWGNGWLFLLTLIPVVGIVVSIITQYKLVKCFGHGVGMFILYLLIPMIALPILAFGSSEYSPLT